MSETVAVDLVAWLTQIWDEEERLAKTAGGDHWILDGGNIYRAGGHGEDVVDWVYDEGWGHIAYHDPASVLARIAADKELLKLHQAYGDECSVCLASATYDEIRDDSGEWVWQETRTMAAYPCPTVRLLASPYKGREGWQEGWDE